MKVSKPTRYPDDACGQSVRSLPTFTRARKQGLGLLRGKRERSVVLHKSLGVTSLNVLVHPKGRDYAQRWYDAGKRGDGLEKEDGLLPQHGLVQSRLNHVSVGARGHIGSRAIDVFERSTEAKDHF